MKLEPPFRRAAKEDARRIAELFRISSGGVADYVWSTMRDDYPGLSLLDIGARRYARENTPFSYQNCVVAERDGRGVIGMLVAFPMAADIPAPDEAEEPDSSGGEPDVLSPYSELEVPGSYYVCGVALVPEARGEGLGTAFMEIARAEALERGLLTLSLLVFEQNVGAVRLYERLGYRVIDRRPVVPHELIHYTGDVLLMAALA
ncbi:MAG TPA: GNAT family N-acetyltransferase [Geminicoccaceae bacterium]|nr:GNAT family N-acetyltransferase [Geminicoccaceae bacterium]